MKIYPNYLGISNTVLIDSQKQWPTTAIFAGIHGDEVSGIKAVDALFLKIKNKKILLQAGKIILVFVANEVATWLARHSEKHDLNHLFRKDINDDGSYECHRATDLMKILDTADYLLDLHSTSGPSIPFLLSREKDIYFAESLWISCLILQQDEVNRYDGKNYINSTWGVGFTFEAGNHDTLDGEKNTTRILLNFLSKLKQIDISYFAKEEYERECITLFDTYVCKTGNFQFQLRNLENFTTISEWTLIGLDGEEEVRAESDYLLVMPNTAGTEKWETVFFKGRRENLKYLYFQL